MKGASSIKKAGRVPEELIRPGEQLDFSVLPSPAGDEWSRLMGRKQRFLSVCEIIQTYDAVGGMEVYLRNLNEGLLERGGTVHMLYMTDRRGDKPRTEKVGNGVVIHHPVYQPDSKLGQLNEFNPMTLLKFSTELSRILESNDVNIVHLHNVNLPISVIGAMVAKAHKAGVAVTHHYGEEHMRGRSLEKLVKRALADITLHFADRKLGVSLSAARALGTGAQVIGTSVDTEYFSPDAESVNPDGIRRNYGLGDSKVILYPARMEPPKGQMDLLKAVKLMAERRKDFKVVLMGRPQSKEYVKALDDYVRDNNLEDFVLILPAADKKTVRDWYAVEDVTVLPSRSEALGLIILESFAMEKPVVATKVGGIPEVVVHGRNGLLVEPENPRQMADALNSVLDDPEMARRMGERGRELVVKEFSPKALVDNYMEVYRELTREVSERRTSKRR